MAITSSCLEELRLGRRLVEEWALQSAASFIRSGNVLYAAGMYHQMSMLVEAKELYLSGKDFGKQLKLKDTKLS